MSRIEQLYNANKIRVKILKLTADQFLEVEELQAHIPDMTRASIRAVCYDLVKDKYLDIIKFSSPKNFKSMNKYKATGKPFKEKTIHEITSEYMESRSNASDLRKGKYDDLIASNPNLRIIRKMDAPLPPDWWGKKKDKFRGIGSSFEIL